MMKIVNAATWFMLVASSGVAEAFAASGVGANARRVCGATWGGAGAASTNSIDRHHKQSAWRYLRKVSPITTRSLLAKGAGVGDADEAVSSDGKKTSSISGIGGTGSNLLLILSSVLVIKGLLLPEDIRHLSFCPSEDPVRGRDTLPWRMMEESGRECGSIPEVMAKYVTAPLVFPGTPEWGMMLNVKEDIAKNAWLE
ncbi:unnamed protein product [Ascophyllum nodosum]